MEANFLAEFTTSNYNWEKLVDKELKQENAAQTLIWEAEEGITLPAYHQALNPAAKQTAERINSLLALEETFTVFNVARVNAIDELEANKEALQVLNGGASGLEFKHLFSQNGEAILKNINLQYIYLGLSGKAADLESWFGIFKKSHPASNQQLGYIDFSPLQQLVKTGSWFSNEKSDFSKLKTLIEQTRDFKLLKTIVVDASLVQNAGGTLTQEIAFALLQGQEYLEQLANLGLSKNELAHKIQFHFAAGQNFYLECVKLNVFKLLWSTILEKHSISYCTPFISTETSTFGASVYDSHNNLLRYTTASLAAILAGSNAHTALPFDSHFKESNTFSQRLAQNITNLLVEESFIDAQNKATQGSYFFENLQHELSLNAWDTFVKWEQAGGYIANVNKGILQSQIEASFTAKQQAFDTQQIKVLGVNRFPNLKESQKKHLEQVKIPNSTSGQVKPLQVKRISAEAELKRMQEEPA